MHDDRLANAASPLTRSRWLMVAGSFRVRLCAGAAVQSDLRSGRASRVNEAPLVAAGVGSADDRSRVALEFMSVLPPGSELELTPEAPTHDVQPGKLYEAKFRIRNQRDRAGRRRRPCRAWRRCHRAIPAEDRMLLLHAAEVRGVRTREFTVRFIVDPALPRQVDRMTLAYSMYTLPQAAAARGSLKSIIR